MADIGVGAVGGIKALAALDESLEFEFQHGEIADA